MVQKIIEAKVFTQRYPTWN